MNLPVLNKLSETESTYITFSKALLDLDEANTNGTEFYFSKVVAMVLPEWKSGTFYKNLNINGITNNNPNTVIPKMVQHYMENILRQPLNEFRPNGKENEPIHEITELAFYKMLGAMEMSKEEIQSRITFCNDIVTSNFTKIENNNGWGEIICQIPNKCRIFKPAFREIPDINDLITCNDVENFGQPDNNEQIPLYDNVNTYSMNNWKSVLDIPNSSFDNISEGSFDFNVLLLFYRDKAGVDKLHGINFIFPFEDKQGNGLNWEQTTFTQKTNIIRSIGYQFIFNLKTCNNEASLIKIYKSTEAKQWWTDWGKSLSNLNSFLEYKMLEAGYDNGTIPHIFGD